jgi:tetratricopeptide (TPR) repeat protein
MSRIKEPGNPRQETPEGEHAAIREYQRTILRAGFTMAAEIPGPGILSALPADVHGFVGRTADLARLDLLRARQAPVAMLTGPAGVGKTALAVHWAHRVAASFPDGTLFVNLDGHSPTPVTAATALAGSLRALGARPEEIPADVAARAALYRACLAGRRTLIVLDDAATIGQVRHLLPGVPGCLVLITGRDRLTGLSPLPLTPLPEDDAAGLLAAATAGHRTDDLDDRRALADRCARLPRALRIAAARAVDSPGTSLGDLAADLGDDVVAWARRALPPDAARLLRLLGAHPGPDFRTAAAAALAGLPLATTRRLLAVLVRAHLLDRLAPDRFRCRGQRTTDLAAARRVLRWHLDALRTAPGFFAQEERNLRAAVDLAADLRLHDLAWLLAATLAPVYAHHQRVGDWLATSETGLRAARLLDDQRAEALLLESLGRAHARAAHLAEAIRYESCALDIHLRLGDRDGRLATTHAIGLVHLRAHDLAEAYARFDETARLADDSDFWRGMAMTGTAHVHLESERYAEAHELLIRALDGHRRLGLVACEGDALRGLSHAQRGLGRPDVARDLVEEALELAREHANPAWEAHWLVECGHVLIALDDLPGALVAFQRAAMLHRCHGDRSREAAAHDGTGTVYRLMGRRDDAGDFHRVAVAAFQDTGERWLLALALDHLAQAVPTEAEQHWRESADLLEDFPDPRATRRWHEITSRIG